jgi:hypothetical protein
MTEPERREVLDAIPLGIFLEIREVVDPIRCAVPPNTTISRATHTPLVA